MFACLLCSCTFTVCVTYAISLVPTPGQVTCVVPVQEYAASRRNQQEAAYNIGRAAHQLGLLHLAAPFYERALATEPPADPSCVVAGAVRSSFDIRKEAAHNLVLIYRTTGAVTLARQVMRQHLVI